MQGLCSCNWSYTSLDNMTSLGGMSNWSGPPPTQQLSFSEWLESVMRLHLISHLPSLFPTSVSAAYCQLLPPRWAGWVWKRNIIVAGGWQLEPKWHSQPPAHVMQKTFCFLLRHRLVACQIGVGHHPPSSCHFPSGWKA